MGVDFSHCDAHWSYSGFNEFRNKVAESAGIVLGDMEGFHHFKLDEAFRDGIEHYREKFRELLAREIAERGPKKSWDVVTDPIKDLLSHSDCDGHLTPQQCHAIAPRLRELVQDWPETVTAVMQGTPEQIQLLEGLGYKQENEYPNYDKVNAFRLAEGMEKAAEKGENLEFR